MKWPLHAVGFGLTLLWMFMVLSSHDTIGLSVFFYLMFLAWGWVIWGMRTAKADTLTVVLCWGVIFRVCALWADPVYEDDWYRYLWDGWQLTVGQPVYGVAPMDSFGDPAVPLVMHEVLDGVNYPDRPTLYGPVTELVFGVAALIKPGSLFTLKCLWLLVDLALLIGMRRWVRPEGFVLYAWCPLLVFEVFVNGHFEVLALGFLMAGWCAREKGLPGWAGILLGLAVGGRWFALPLALLMLRGTGRQGWISFSIIQCLLGWIAWEMGRSDNVQVWTFLNEWEFNSLAFGLIQWAGSRDLALAVFFLGSTAVFFWAWYRNDPRAGEWVILVLLLLSPVINPWYFLWLLPFAVMRPRGWHVAVMVAVPLAYVYPFNYGGEGFEHAGWVRPTEVLLALAVVLCWKVFGLEAERDGKS